MVYTLTLNPAIDYVLYAPDVCEGAINRSGSEELFPGGKGINVSLVLKAFGIDTTALGFCAGFTGDMLCTMLEDTGLPCDFVKLPSGSTRINVKIKSQKETDINASGPVIDYGSLEELYDKLEVLEDGDWLVVAGASAPGLSSDIYCDILEHIKHKKIRIVADTTKDLLTNVLRYKPFMIKPNNIELSEIFCEDLDSDEKIIEKALILRKMGAENVLVSLGGDGAILICDNGDILKEEAPDGMVINTTGAGDSTVAGFIAAIEEKNDFSYALRLAVCAGSAAAFSKTLPTYDEIMKLFSEK